jgi:hypothetical protein
VSAPDPSKKLAALIRRLRADAQPPAPDHPETPEEAEVQQLLLSFLAWEAGPARASAALKKLLANLVDVNELRVCLPDEIAKLIGERYPRCLERCVRMRSALADVYRREHAVTLKHLAQMPVRDARAYLASLEGAPNYVTCRLVLLSFGGHAFPLDERMRDALAAQGALPPGMTVDDASAWLERQFRAGEAAPAYLAVEAWLADQASQGTKRRAPVRSPSDDSSSTERTKTRGKRAARPPSS